VQRRGYVLLELLIAVAIVAGLTASLFAIMSPSFGAFATQPEAADVQQRLRVAADSVAGDLLMAGSGSYAGAMPGSLDFSFASVLPYRHGGPGADSPGTFRSDAITVIYVPSTASQTTAAGDVSANVFVVNSDAGCPLGEDACGFSKGDTMLVYDSSGNFDTFTITAVGAAGGTMVPNNPSAFSPAHKAGSKIAKAIERTYQMEPEPNGRFNQLVSYDGSARGGVPVVDHLAGLTFEYFGDPQPPALRTPGACDPAAPPPCTTYGPPPPPVGVQPAGYPPGENCVFAVDAASRLQVSRLGVIGAGGSSLELVPLGTAEFTDGPWCPDASSPGRFDADLLRIRMIRVTLRIEAAVDALRGPAGVLFARGGTARDLTRVIPDREIQIEVSPRNLNFGR
jgi:prepilin-type N-terminal cleavage/methylation domain-containing protein